MAIALGTLAVREETLWYHQMQLVLGAGHPRRLLAAGRSARQGVEHCRTMAAMRSNGSTDALLQFVVRKTSALATHE